MVNVSSLTTCISLNNKPWVARPTPIDLNFNEYNQRLHYYPFVAKLDRSNGSCNTLKDPSNKIRVPNKTEDLNVYVFSMTTGINKSKILTKHISWKCKYKFYGQKCNSNE